MSKASLLSLSLVLLGCALVAAFLGRRSRKQAVALGGLVLFVFLLTAAFVAADRFTGDGIDQAVLYHMTYGLEGAGVSEYSLLIAGVTLIVLVGAGLALGSTVFLVRGATPAKSLPTTWAALPLAAAACLVNPASHDLVQLFASPDTIAALSRGRAVHETDFGLHYRVPALGPDPRPSRSFVYIYAEGMERTYLDPAIFPGLLVGIRELEAISTSFTNIGQTPGTSFTMGGIVGSQCGLPLLGGNFMSGMSRFLPEAVCLGDLLRQRGYHLSFLGGASLAFAGKGKFLSAHGFAEVDGREQLLPTQPDPAYRSGWGLHDDSLLDIAYDKVMQLASRAQPFGVFLLTLDTHPPDGHISRRVENVRYEGGDVAILNAVAGSDRLLSAFVQRLRDSEHGKELVIILTSDHLALENGASERLNTGTRRNLFMILDPAGPYPRRIDKPGNTLDIGPTLLHALGYRASLGLGRDLLGADRSLSEELPDLKAAISAWKRELAGFWGMSRLTSIEVRTAEQLIEVGGTTIRLPALITFDSGYNAEVFFEVDTPKLLREQVHDLASGTPFVWVAKYEDAKIYAPDFAPEVSDLCIVGGRRGAQPTLVRSATARAHVSAEDLAVVLGSRAEPELYAEQTRRLSEAQLPDGFTEMVASAPEGSVFFHPKDRTTPYLERYLSSPPVAAKRIALRPKLPSAGEFFFASRNEKEVRKSGLFRSARLVYGEDLVSLLRRHRPSTVIVAVRDEGRSRLSDASLDYFRDLGIDLRRLKFRGSFAAVIEAGNAVAQAIDNEGPVVLESEALRRLGIDRVESAGNKVGNYSRIVVNGKDLSNNRRGFNLVLLERGNEPVALSIDTHTTERLASDVFRAVPQETRATAP